MMSHVLVFSSIFSSRVHPVTMFGELSYSTIRHWMPVEDCGLNSRG